MWGGEVSLRGGKTSNLCVGKRVKKKKKSWVEKENARERQERKNERITEKKRSEEKKERKDD